MTAPLQRLSALLVDDERLARAELRSLLAVHPEIAVAGEAASLEEARRALAETEPDVVFLDIQMPGGTGFDVLESIPTGSRVVFVTAYSEFALRAFEANAVDYLLKPVHPARLAETVSRLLRRVPRGAAPRAPLHPDDPLIVPDAKHYRIVRVKEIVSIHGAKDNSEVRTTDGRTTLVSRSLKEWEETLPPRTFLRIHRSTIVNVDQVERIEPWFNSSFRIYLRRATEPLEVSRRFATLLRERVV